MTGHEGDGISILISVFPGKSQIPLPIMNFTNECLSSDMELDDCSEYTQKNGKQCDFRQKNRLHWSVEENTKYCHFLYQNRAIFESELLRKKSRVFFQMALFIQTRNKSCAKSHHQKMIKRHKSVEEIIRFMQEKYRIVVIPEEGKGGKQKENEVQTDRESQSEVDLPKQGQKQKENLQTIIKDNIEPEQIGYDGFDISQWEW